APRSATPTSWCSTTRARSCPACRSRSMRACVPGSDGSARLAPAAIHDDATIGCMVKRRLDKDFRMMPIDESRNGCGSARRLAGSCAATSVLMALTSAASFAQEATPESVAAPVIGAAALPRDLSPWGMYQSADVVVKGVLI